MDKHQPALSPDEFTDGAIECSPDHKWDLEAAALEQDGTLNLWNASGQTVEVSPKRRDKVVSLLLQGRLSGRHMNALIEATEQDRNLAPSTKAALRDLFDEILRYAPPATTPVLRADLPAAALLWTLTPELRITSCTGNAKQFLRESDRQILEGSPDLWTLLGTTDPTNQMIAAHLTALTGEPVKLTYQRTVEWAIYLHPVRNTEGEIAGVVGYATVSNKLPTTAPATEAAYLVTTPEGTILSHAGNLLAIAGLADPPEPENIVGREMVELVHHHFIHAVEDPKPFVKRLAAVLSSTTEEMDRVVLNNGRVLHRQMQPLKDSVGNVMARAWVVTEVAARRAAKTVAAVLLVGALGAGSLLNGDWDSSSMDTPTMAMFP